MELLNLYKEQRKNAHFPDVYQMRYQEELEYIYLENLSIALQENSSFLSIFMSNTIFLRLS